MRLHFPGRGAGCGQNRFLNVQDLRTVGPVVLSADLPRPERGSLQHLRSDIAARGAITSTRAATISGLSQAPDSWFSVRLTLISLVCRPSSAFDPRIQSSKLRKLRSAISGEC